MGHIHDSFSYHMSVALEDHSVPYGDFCRSRGYKDFRLDLEEQESEVEIAAAALSELCNGSEANMDAAVVDAVLQYLESHLGSSRMGFSDMASGIWRRLPIARADAKRLLKIWYAP